MKKWKVTVDNVDIGMTIQANTKAYAYGQAVSAISKSIKLEEIKPEEEEKPSG